MVCPFGPSSFRHRGVVQNGQVPEGKFSSFALRLFRRLCVQPLGVPSSSLTAAPFQCAQPGKVIVLLTGKYAGKKAVIVKNVDDGSSTRPYGHAVVCGLSKEPRKVSLVWYTSTASA